MMTNSVFKCKQDFIEKILRLLYNYYKDWLISPRPIQYIVDDVLYNNTKILRICLEFDEYKNDLYFSEEVIKLICQRIIDNFGPTNNFLVEKYGIIPEHRLDILINILLENRVIWPDMIDNVKFYRLTKNTINKFKTVNIYDMSENF